MITVVQYTVKAARYLNLLHIESYRDMNIFKRQSDPFIETERKKIVRFLISRLAIFMGLPFLLFLSLLLYALIMVISQSK